MRSLGLKLWSKDFIRNLDFVKSAEVALKDGAFDYLELFALPDSFDEANKMVRERFCGIKTIIHAPHNIQGLNIADKNEFLNNKKRLVDAQRFADLLDAPYIILHPGMGVGEEFIDESIRQFKDFNDSRLAVENLPSYCSQTKNKLHGITPIEIKRFIDEAKALFCLDFSHAICGANACNCDVFSF